MFKVNIEHVIAGWDASEDNMKTSTDHRQIPLLILSELINFYSP